MKQFHLSSFLYCLPICFIQDAHSTGLFPVLFCTILFTLCSSLCSFLGSCLCAPFLCAPWHGVLLCSSSASLPVLIPSGSSISGISCVSFLVMSSAWPPCFTSVSSGSFVCSFWLCAYSSCFFPLCLFPCSSRACSGALLGSYLCSSCALLSSALVLCAHSYSATFFCLPSCGLCFCSFQCFLPRAHLGSFLSCLFLCSVLGSFLCSFLCAPCCGL